MDTFILFTNYYPQTTKHKKSNKDNQAEVSMKNRLQAPFWSFQLEVKETKHNSATDKRKNRDLKRKFHAITDVNLKRMSNLCFIVFVVNTIDSASSSHSLFQ